VNPLHAIDDTKRALKAARAFLTMLGDLPRSPAHREMMTSQTSVILSLESELAQLRYQARHPEVRA
jgi:hypothetical protein